MAIAAVSGTGSAGSAERRGLESDDLVSRLEVFFRERYYKELLKAAHSRKPLLVSFSDLETFDPLLADALLETPAEVFKAVDLALKNIDFGQELEKKPNVRFLNIPETQIIAIRDIRSAQIGKLIGVKGIIKQASEVKPEITEATFECDVCGALIKLLQDTSRLKRPYMCDCGNKRGFELKSRQLIDIQRIVIEESPDAIEGGSQPRKISSYLRDDLTDPKFQRKVVPGNKVLVSGILNDVPLKVQGIEESKRRDIYIDGNWLEPIEQEFEEIEITPEDEQKIQELAARADIYETMIKSIAPSIFGYEEIKEAIALQLFSGVKKQRADGVMTRGDIHIFLVGDPGVAKSQILRYVSILAPKARYVVGTSASGAGITATVVRDDFIKGWALEAGALVLTNRGLCCVDEIDKMNAEDRVRMHEVMEQQSVTISKANIQATLNAQTTILAAANPKYGRFDPYGAIAEQIDLPPTLLNRFDLIFPLKDVPDPERDTRMVRHMLQLHEAPDVIEAPISSEMLRKFVAYAKLHCKPKLTKAAEREIEKFYVGLRGRYSGEEAPAIPISPRQLEALVRLAEASARIRLSNKVTEEDARRAIKLLTACLQQVALDMETGRFDIDRIESGTTATQRNKIRTIIRIVSELEAESEDRSVSFEDVVAEAEEQGIDDREATELIEKLKRENELFEPRRGRLKRLK